MNKTLAPLLLLLLADCATEVPKALPPRCRAEIPPAPLRPTPRSWPEPDWWQGFGDPQLTSLISARPRTATATSRWRGAVMQAEPVCHPALGALPPIAGQAQACAVVAAGKAARNI